MLSDVKRDCQVYLSGFAVMFIVCEVVRGMFAGYQMW